jgi:hypothetical protein
MRLAILSAAGPMSLLTDTASSHAVPCRCHRCPRSVLLPMYPVCTPERPLASSPSMGIGTRDATPLLQHGLAPATRALAEGTLRAVTQPNLGVLGILGGLGDFSPSHSD